MFYQDSAYYVISKWVQWVSQESVIVTFPSRIHL